MRKLSFVVLAAVAAAAAHGVVASRLRARVGELLPAATRAFQEKANVRIDHGDVTVSYFPFAARVNRLRVSGPLDANAPFLEMEALEIRVKPLSVLRGRLDVSEVVADRPRIELLKDPLDARRSSTVPDSLLDALAETPFSVTVRDGSILYEDRSDDPPSKLLAGPIDGAIRGGTDGRLDVNLEGRALGESSTAKLSLRHEPKVGPTGGADVALELDIKGASAASLREGFVLLRGAELRDPLEFSLRAQGLFGEKSTETKPAEPLLGKLRGSVGVAIAGIEDRLEIDLDVALDDARYQVRGGTGTWAGLRFVPTGWITRLPPRKLAGRLELDPFELSEMAERFGVNERWRPHGIANLTVRALGTSTEPFYRYEGTLQEPSFSAWAALPIKAGVARVRGSLVAVNTDASVSFDVTDLQVGTAHIDQLMFGCSYWKEKLNVSALESPVYGGKLDGAVAFFPKTSADPQGGMLLRDTDGKTVIENVVPGLPFTISGRLDTGMQLGVDEQGLWFRGRVGLHRGRIDGSNWTRELIAAVLADAGAGDTLDHVIAAHRPLLGAEATRFQRAAIDFRGRGGTVELPRVVLEMPGAELRAHGEIAADHSVKLTGALWPDEELAAGLVGVAPLLARARDADGDTVLPCEVRGAKGRVRIEPSADLRAALTAGGDVAPLDPVRVGPADFGDLPGLRQQFGR
jgi:hypothetical protein